jgi:hypothetical protein
MFLALDSTTNACRVKVQFTVMLGPYEIYGFINPQETGSAAIKTMIKCCQGHGSNLARRGVTWLALGITKYWLDPSLWLAHCRIIRDKMHSYLINLLYVTSVDVDDKERILTITRLILQAVR